MLQRKAIQDVFLKNENTENRFWKNKQQTNLQKKFSSSFRKRNIIKENKRSRNTFWNNDIETFLYKNISFQKVLEHDSKILKNLLYKNEIEFFLHKRNLSINLKEDRKSLKSSLYKESFFVYSLKSDKIRSKSFIETFKIKKDLLSKSYDNKRNEINTVKIQRVVLKRYGREKKLNNEIEKRILSKVLNWRNTLFENIILRNKELKVYSVKSLMLQSKAIQGVFLKNKNTENRFWKNKQQTNLQRKFSSSFKQRNTFWKNGIEAFLYKKIKQNLLQSKNISFQKVLEPYSRILKNLLYKNEIEFFLHKASLTINLKEDRESLKSNLYKENFFVYSLKSDKIRSKSFIETFKIKKDLLSKSYDNKRNEINTIKIQRVVLKRYDREKKLSNEIEKRIRIKVLNWGNTLFENIILRNKESKGYAVKSLMLQSKAIQDIFLKNENTENSFWKNKQQTDLQRKFSNSFKERNTFWESGIETFLYKNISFQKILEPYSRILKNLLHKNEIEFFLHKTNLSINLKEDRKSLKSNLYKESFFIYSLKSQKTSSRNILEAFKVKKDLLSKSYDNKRNEINTIKIQRVVLKRYDREKKLSNEIEKKILSKVLNWRNTLFENIILRNIELKGYTVKSLMLQSKAIQDVFLKNENTESRFWKNKQQTDLQRKFSSSFRERNIIEENKRSRNTFWNNDIETFLYKNISFQKVLEYDSIILKNLLHKNEIEFFLHKANLSINLKEGRESLKSNLYKESFFVYSLKSDKIRTKSFIEAFKVKKDLLSKSYDNKRNEINTVKIQRVVLKRYGREKKLNNEIEKRILSKVLNWRNTLFENIILRNKELKVYSVKSLMLQSKAIQGVFLKNKNTENRFWKNKQQTNLQRKFSSSFKQRNTFWKNGIEAFLYKKIKQNLLQSKNISFQKVLEPYSRILKNLLRKNEIEFFLHKTNLSINLKEDRESLKSNLYKESFFIYSLKSQKTSSRNILEAFKVKKDLLSKSYDNKRNEINTIKIQRVVLKRYDREKKLSNEIEKRILSKVLNWRNTLFENIILRNIELKGYAVKSLMLQSKAIQDVFLKNENTENGFWKNKQQTNLQRKFSSSFKQRNTFWKNGIEVFLYKQVIPNTLEINRIVKNLLWKNDIESLLQKEKREEKLFWKGKIRVFSGKTKYEQTIGFLLRQIRFYPEINLKTDIESLRRILKNRFKTNVYKKSILVYSLESGKISSKSFLEAFKVKKELLSKSYYEKRNKISNIKIQRAKIYKTERILDKKWNESITVAGILLKGYQKEKNIYSRIQEILSENILEKVLGNGFEYQKEIISKQNKETKNLLLKNYHIVNFCNMTLTHRKKLWLRKYILQENLNTKKFEEQIQNSWISLKRQYRLPENFQIQDSILYRHKTEDLKNNLFVFRFEKRDIKQEQFLEEKLKKRVQELFIQHLKEMKTSKQIEPSVSDEKQIGNLKTFSYPEQRVDFQEDQGTMEEMLYRRIYQRLERTLRLELRRTGKQDKF